MKARPSSAHNGATVAALIDRLLVQFESPANRRLLRPHARRVGSSVIEQRHLGASLEDLFHPAWGHLPAESGKAPARDDRLVVYCADVEATGLDPGPLPWRSSETAQGGLVAGLEGSDYRALWDPEGRALHLFERRRRLAIYVVGSRRDFRSWERSIPLRHILHWWTQQRGGQLVHAGAVGNEEGGILLLGASGAGKSTTTLACLASGLKIASDDFVLIEPGAEPDGDKAVIHSVSATAKLSRQALERFPDLASRMVNPQEPEPEKALFFLDSFQPSPLIGRMPLKGVVMLNRCAQVETTCSPVSAAMALQASAPNTLFLLPGERAQSFARLAALFRRYPCFRLDLGSDLRQIPDRIGQLLAKL
jgi:hypothetical protein